MIGQVFMFRKRPCTVVATAQKQLPRAMGGRRYTQVQVRYLDGEHPASVTCGQGGFTKAKPITGQQGIYWTRVKELIAQGFRPDEAKKQAMAEQNKGVLAEQVGF